MGFRVYCWAVGAMAHVYEKKHHRVREDPYSFGVSKVLLSGLNVSTDSIGGWLVEKNAYLNGDSSSDREVTRKTLLSHQACSPRSKPEQRF